MKKHLLRALCLTFVLALCMPMVACDMELGGLVGELMQDMNADGGNHDIMDITPEIDKNWADVMTSAPETEIATEDFTYDWPVTGEPTIMPPEQITGSTTTAPETMYDSIVDNIPNVTPIVHFSIDECDAWIGEERVIQFFTPGQSNGWDGQPVIEDANVEYIRVWGWIAFGSETLGQLGYQIDENPVVFDQSFLLDAEEPLLQFQEYVGAGSITRIEVHIPIRDLSGSRTLRVIARAEDGYEEVLVKIVMDKAIDPNAPFTVPFEAWTVSGHSPQIIDQSQPSLYPMIQAGGIEQGALLHQGSVGIGEYDLSQYSKIIVYYGIDASQVTVDNYNANANNRIMITNTDTNLLNSPEEYAIVASTVYTLTSWQVVPIEIDLSDVDYNGPVFISYDTLPGTFMIIGSIVLVK